MICQLLTESIQREYSALNRCVFKDPSNFVDETQSTLFLLIWTAEGIGFFSNRNVHHLRFFHINFISLIWARMPAVADLGTMAIMSSTYLFQKSKWTGRASKICRLIFCMINSARTTEIGETITVPLICS